MGSTKNYFRPYRKHYSTLSNARFGKVECMIRQGRMHDSVQVPLQACVAGARPFFRLQRRNGKKSGYSLSRRTCLRSVVRLGFRPNHTLGWCKMGTTMDCCLWRNQSAFERCLNGVRMAFERHSKAGSAIPMMKWSEP